MADVQEHIYSAYSLIDVHVGEPLEHGQIDCADANVLGFPDK